MSVWLIKLAEEERVPMGTGTFIGGTPDGDLGQELMITVGQPRVVEHEGILQLDHGDVTIIKGGLPVVGYARGAWLSFERKEA